MTDIRAWIAHLNEMGVKIWTDGDRLRYKVPRSQESMRDGLRLELRSRKAEVMAFLNDSRVLRSLPDEIPTLPPGQEPIPTPAQQRLWFLSQLEGQNAIYNIVSLYRMEGEMDETALGHALKELVRRHDSLRLIFPTTDGKPGLKKIPAYDPLTVDGPDALTAWDNPADSSPGNAPLDRWINRQAQSPFDLEQGPLFRAALLRHTHREHLLVFTLHHIIGDAWSLGVLIRDLGLIYNARIRDLPAALPKLPAGYLDYAAHRQAQLEQGAHEGQLAYWKRQLAGIPELLELPTDFPRPARMRYRGKRLIRSLPRELTQKVKALGRRHGVTDFMTLLSAFTGLLYRYTGQEDLVVGSPIANRTRLQTEEMVGLFANTLPYRLYMNGNLSFAQLLARVKQTALDAYQHQDIPFETLVEKINPARSMSHSPLYQVMFMLQNAPESGLCLDGLNITPLAPDQMTARLDLTLEIIEENERFTCGWEYNTDLFTPDTIGRMAGHLGVLLEAAVTDPERTLSRLPLMTRQEAGQWTAWNTTRAAYPEDKTLVDLFQRRVKESPDHTALVFETRTVTFRELNQVANRLARHLKAQGVESGTLVGLCVERSVDLLVGLLGILKAGGAYVPLDPAYPKARLQDILDDARSPVLVTQSHLLERFSSLPESIVCLDCSPEPFLELSSENPARISDSCHPAYVIYTSGSTGKPKGVMIGHKALTNFLTAMQQTLGFSSKDRMLALTTISFDIAALELFLPLITGGRTVVVSRDTAASPPDLIRAMEREKITHMQATPATWKMLVESGWQQNCPLTILTGGEALPARLGRALLANSLQLWNVYGPTETTIWSSIHDASQYPDHPELIGTPLANTRIFILDKHLSPLPWGVPGELCIGGHGLAEGYLNRPELTAERFVTLPLFGRVQRIYRTGDLARLRQDGNLEYLGRLDHQIKLRGFRIELGEIENVLGRHPGVKEAVVVLDREDTPCLAAYVTRKAREFSMKAPGAELKPWLRDRLPEYMIPAVFTVLDRLPLTPNGKIDRKALPAPSRPAPHPLGSRPRTPREKCLAEIWGRVLKRPKVGIFDNFFEQGGDSILSVQIVAGVRAAGLALTPRDLFLHQTIAELARAAVEIPKEDSPRTDEVPGPAVNLDPEKLDRLEQRYENDIEDIYPLSPMQQGMLFHWLHHPSENRRDENRTEKKRNDSRLYFEQFHCRIKGPLNLEAFHSAWQTLVDHHATLRTAFCHDIGAPSQVVLKKATLHWRTLDWRDLAPDRFSHRFDSLLSDQRRQDFDLDTPPLMRIQVIREADETFRMVWNHHHLLMDGWSHPILFAQLLDAYHALSRGNFPRLPQAPLFRDYIDWLGRQDRARAKAHWQQHLSGFTAPTPLPGRQENLDPAGFGEVFLPVPAHLNRELNRFSRQHRLTLNTLVQGAWACLLSRYSGGGADPVVFGVTTSGRDVPILGIETMVGLFINTLPLKAVPDSRPVLHLLQAIQADQQRNGRFAHTALSDIQKWSRVPQGSPLFETLVVFENYPVDERLKEEGFAGSLEICDFGGSEHTNYPVTLTVLPGDSLEVRLTFDRQRFTPEQMTRMLDHLTRLLEGITSHPLMPSNRLEMLTNTEQEQIGSWNRTRVPFPRSRTIVDQIRTRARQAPKSLALAELDKKLTYLSLEEKTNQLARYLKKSGVGKESLVGICMDRSPELVIGLLGILKAGGAYVPVDPAYPSSRIRFMLEDAAAPVVLTRDIFLKKLPATRARIISMDRDQGEIARESAQSLACPSGPADLAYVIYTSGSTGRPKGVMVEHRSLANMVHWHIQAFSILPEDRVAMTASTAFDASGWEIWPYLCAGAALIPMDPETLLAPAKTVKGWLDEQRISVVFMPTVLAENLISSPTQPEHLRLMLTGGDRLRDYPPPHCRFILSNNYGPTESTVVATSGRVPRAGLPGSRGFPSIGRPIANTRVYILGPGPDGCRQVPPGLPGELCIAGEGLARGYLNRPELTAEKFVTADIAGLRQRIYRTGDAARFCSDGTIEYLGRLDHQVSLRGFRIELPEIELCLKQHPRVKGAVALVREAEGEKGRNSRLDAYVTCSEDAPPPTESLAGTLTDWLKDRLPAYMIPAQIRVLKEFPLTANGKIDPKALPRDDSSEPGRTWEPPRTHEERQLLRIWQDVLASGDIGIFDNYFEQGGDSILSIQIVARAREKGLVISSSDLFRHQTVAELAQAARPVKDLPRAGQGPAQGELSLAPIQQRFFATGPAHHYNQAVLLDVPGDIDPDALRTAWRAVLNHHDALRLRFRKTAKGWTGWYDAPGEPPWQVEDLSRLPEKDQAPALENRVNVWQRRLDLEKGPLARLILFCLGDRARIFWCIHHLVVDGVSWRILMEDLRQAYEQALEGTPVRLPEKTAAFHEWTRRILAWKVEDADYFRNLPTPKPLPRDDAGSDLLEPGDQIRHHTVRIPREETRCLLTQAPAAFNTRINDLLLTALMLTLAEWTDEPEWVIDLESHGRTDLFRDMDISRTVGWFTSLYSLRLSLPEGRDPETALKQIKEQIRRVPDGGMGYGILRWLHREKLPQGQILFNYLGQFTPPSQDSDWQFAQEESGQDTFAREKPDYPMEINARTVDGQLSLTWSYSTKDFQESTIQGLGHRFRHHLLDLVARCSTALGYTPSDFPLSGLVQADLDRLARQYGNGVADIYPLSPMQQGMLFHTLHDPEHGAYFEQFHGIIKGELDLTALEGAWHHLVLRHPILRTAFCHHLAPQVQVVLKAAEMPLEILDWRRMSKRDQGRELEKLLQSERSRGFDLETPPLMRVQLILESRDTLRLVLHHHHMLLDGWSLPILFTELTATAAALSQTLPPGLPRPPLYREYIEWLGRQDRESALNHWKDYLSGFTAPTPLPRDPACPREKGHDALTLTLPPELGRQLKGFSQAHRLTLSTLFQGAWAALLSRYSDQDEVVFGVTVSGRQAPVSGIDKMLGLFINTLPLRISADKSNLLDLLSRIQEEHLENSRYGYAGLADIQNASPVPNGTPLFETLLVFENYPMDPRAGNTASGLELRDFTGIEYTTYPLSLSVMPQETILLRLTYDKGRFTRPFAEQLIHRLTLLLEGMTARPDRPWFDLPLWSGSERRRMEEWNRTRHHFDEEPTILHLFESQVEKTPDNTAVVFGKTCLDYRTLNREANRLARLLTRRGAGPGILVGICMDRSSQMVVALLGVLKSGAAYLPLDTEYPPARLAFMATDAQIPLLLTRSGLSGRLPAADGIEVIELDNETKALAAQSGENLSRQSRPEDLAYVIYTSGSTGTPKGVMVEHRALRNHMLWMQQTFDFQPGDRFLQKTPFSFDPSIWEFYAPLIIGATLVMAVPGGHRDPEYLLKTMADEKITVLRVVPSLLKMLVQASDFSKAKSLRYLFCGGEPLPRNLVKDVYRVFPGIRFFNLYGPTEAAIVASSWHCRPDRARVAIGRPVANTRIFILDRHHNPQPPGIPGELCITGKSLARGYLNRPELTQERFMEIEIRGEKLRLYRTGDLALWNPDGNLEYLGRKDHQVKLRGMRIEPGEIEAVLCSHPEISGAVVTLREEKSPRLAAYVTLAEGAKKSTSGLRTWLKDRLPDFMVPAAITVLTALPLTPGGKIDRQALPDPDQPALEGSFASPRTEAEQLLLTVWRDVLNQPDLGVYDNFFEQGGDSILSIQIVAKARDHGLGLSPRDLFEHQTVADLALRVRAIAPAKDCDQGQVAGRLPLSPIQQRFFSRRLDDPRQFNQALLLALPGKVDETAMKNALAALIFHHDALRLRFRREDKGWTGWIAGPAEGPLPFHVEALDRPDAEQDLARRTAYWQTRFDLENGPILRLVLFTMGGRTRLFWSVHHLAVDAVSWRILLEDLKTAYHQALSGQSCRLPQKTSSYQAFTKRLAAWKETRTFEREVSGYWRHLRATAPLPVDRPEGTNRLSDTRDYTIRLSREYTRRLLTRVHTAYRTRINDLLLTALMLALAEWTDSPGALIDLEGHGRTDLFEELDLSRTVGWFTAIHPVALALPKDPNPGRALMAIKEQLRQVPSNGLGYGVAKWLGQEALAQGQILFNYLGRFDTGTQENGWALSLEETPPASTAGGERLYLMEINGQVLKDRLSLTWTYSGRKFFPETVETLGKRYRHHLEELIEHCAEGWGYTPSDFPLAGLGQDPLDQLAGRYSHAIADIYPLSPMQQGMLFHSLDAPEEGLYVEQRHCRFRGAMDTDIFYRAWQVLVDRHPILRTAVCHDLGAPFQIVLKEAQVPWQVIDWRESDPNHQGEKMKQAQNRLADLLDTQRKQGFDLARPPLMRIQMIRESDTAWRMVWHHHHLLLDGWCLPVLFAELFQTYGALLEKKSFALPQVPPYRTYIEWLNRQDPETAKSHWQSYLKGFAAPTPLPLGRHSRKPAVFRDLDLSLSLSLNRELTRFSRTHHLTLNTIIQGAWAALLGRYTGEEEVVFGATTSGRQAPIVGIDRMMGLFINTLPMRVKLKETSVLDLLKAVQKAQQQNDRYAHTALSDIRQWSEVAGGVSLFETLVIFENYPMAQSPGPDALPGGLWAEEAAGIEQNNYPLTLAVIPQETLRIKLTFDRHRLPEEGMPALLDHFKRLLAQMVAHSDLAVGRLPMLNRAEIGRQIAWNRAPVPLPQPTTLITRFEAQVETYPDHIALVYEQEEVCYADLNARANRLARYLKPLGIGPETLVGICMDRSVDMIVAILGILKAGGAYVPLDPSYPKSRLAFILKDAGLTLVLSRSDLQDRVPGDNGIQLACLDTLNLDGRHPDIPGRGTPDNDFENLPGQSRPENLAYIIYTSGSTGNPKGCQITHANVSHLISATAPEFGFNGEDVWTLFHSFAFDFSVWEIFGALLHGGKLVIPSFAVTRSPEAFYKLLTDRKVTVLNQTPSAFNQLIRVNTRPDDLSLRLVIFGGEALDVGILKDWYACHAPNLPRLVNMYGITETTVHVTAYPLTARDLPGEKCIGFPIAHWEAWVLDEHQQPVPVGVPGELYVAGAGLARGYLNRPKLTAQRFLKLSLFDRIRRLYRTGDRVRRRADGRLEYLGRTDHQVQLKGFRIELPEIESAIKAHEKIAETAVVLCRVNQRPCLAAYVTCREKNSIETDLSGQDKIPGLIRAWLKTLLPDHMIPASITVLDRMPLTSNGKIDRKALPAPDGSVFTRAFEAPRTDTESRLLEVWRRVLNQPDMGIFDNFFEHGGDSILSIQIVSRARAMGMALAPGDLFNHQTVAELSRAVKPLTEKQAVPQGPVSGEVPLTPIQLRFFSVLRPHPDHFNQAVMLKVPADTDAGALKKALSSIIDHHDALRLLFRRHKGTWSGHHQKDLALPWHIEDLRHINAGDEREQALAARADFWQASLDLSRGPLMRMVLFDLKEETRIFWCIHHLLVDGVSWRILLEDLFLAYSQAAAGTVVRLPDKTTSFQRWAQVLHQMGKNHPPRGTEKRLAGPGQEICWQAPAKTRPLPVDHIEGPNRIMDEQRHTLCLTPGRTRHLLNTAPAAFRTRINDILLTALMLTLRDWTGQNRALIDLESHGRVELDPGMDLSRTVGWFTSLYPQLLNLPPDPEPETALKSIKEQLRQVPLEGIDYGIRRWIGNEPLPQGEILFNYLGQFDQVLSETLWQPAPEESGCPADPAGTRDYLLEINSRVQDGCLSLTWTYSGRQYDPCTIETLGTAYLNHLETILTLCDSVRGFTPSDFPLVSLTQAQLDLLAHRYPGNIADIYPLSPMQQGMLFHSLREPESGVYFEQIHCGLKGQLDIGAFHRAWQHLVRRHEVLRTAFCHDLDAPPLQLVLKNADLSWQVLDWRHLEGPERRKELDALLSAGLSRGIDLDQAPLMRLQMIREEDESWRMVWHHHHILLDGWSLPILLTDLISAYGAYTRNQHPGTEQALPYRTYIAWLAQQDRRAASRYWQESLAGFTAPTALPLAPPAGGAVGYRKVTATLDTALTQRLTRFSRTHRLTLNTLVQGAWATLLSRYTRETDILFGVTTSGRQVPIDGIDRMVGLFINTLPLRVKLSRQGPILDDLQQIQETHQRNSRYAHTPLAEIQALSEIPGGTPLFDTILIFENYPVDDTQSPFSGKIEVTNVEGTERTNYPVTLAVTPGQGLRFTLTFDTRSFREADMERMLAHLHRLLEGMVTCSHPSQLPLLTPTEEDRIRSWNRTRTDLPLNLTITALFHNQVRKTPDRTAVIFENRTLTYGSLNDKANRLACRLRQMGVGPDTLVGIFLDRSLEMVIALLGTLKAGGAYVPMDPDYPGSRLQFMIEDAEVRVMLSRSELLDRLPLKATCQRFCLDKGWEKGLEPAENPAVPGGPDNLAYAMYTSGSTGRPKGVMVGQGALVNHMRWMQQTFCFSEDDVFLQKTPFSFDASVWEFYAPLLSGGTLVMAEPGGHLDPGYMLRAIHDHGITVLQLVPTALGLMLESPEIRTAGSLRCLFCGGEPLTPDLARTFLQKCPRTSLFNLYGPTEATIDAACWPVPPRTSEITIGRPVDNVRIYILDQDHNLMPPGLPGELCIAGRGLAKGYLNNARQTAEKFVEATILGKRQRIYKTGDEAFWQEDGNLVFLGRTDHQVKFRGFRVELQEIETILKAHPAVAHAVVSLYRKSDPPRLAAYVVLDRLSFSGPGPDRLTQTLLTWAGERLPAHMVPSSVTVLDKFPLTPSGKTDRNRLPDPDAPKSHARFLGPRNHKELRLARIWEDLLTFPHIGIRDNFFELGGHSILAVRLASRIRQEFNTRIPLSTLMQQPTIEALAESLKENGRAAGRAWSPLVPINSRGNKPPLFCVHPAGGTVFCYYDLARHLGEDQPFYGLQSLGIEDGQEACTRMEDMAETYLRAIQSVQPQGPYQLAGWSFGGQAAFEMACQLQARGESVSLLAVLDAFMRPPGESSPALGDDAGLMFDLLTEHGVCLSLDTLRQLSLDDQLLYVKEQGRQVGYFPSDMGLEELRRLFRVYRANLKASLAYTPDSRFSGEIILFKAEEQPDRTSPGPDLGWTGHATHGVRVIPARGHHHNMAQVPHAKHLARILRGCLK